MRNDLMAKQIKVDPGVGAASFRAAEHPAVERARGRQVMDRKSNVKRIHFFFSSFSDAELMQ